MTPSATAYSCFWVLLAAFAGSACHKEHTTLPLLRQMPAPVSTDLTSVWFADSLHGVITGGKPWDGGVLLSTADGGQSWQLDTTLNNRMDCVMIHPGGQAYACGLDGLVLFRSPAGKHWYPFRNDWCWNRACFFPDDNYGVVVSAEGIVRTYGPDAAWRLDSVQDLPNELDAVWFSDATTVHAVGMGWVMRSGDAGRSWTRHDITGDFFRSVHFPDAQTGYICGYNGTLLKSTDGGRSWQGIRRGGALGRRHRAFTDVWFVNAEKGYLCGDEGLFWRTLDGGVHWEEIAGLPENIDFSDVFVRENRGWLTGEAGHIFYFED